LAVSLGEEGLLVPVVRNAGALDLKETARVVDDLAARSRSRKLRPDEVRGGTFTLTNHGSSGSLFATPIIVQPQVGILGIGAVRKRVVVVEGAGGQDAIAIRPMAYLSFVFDHRVTDGEGADRFLMSVKDELENWR
jgi:2-oxoglutarate dehydrogenase E2 component (dihydrolipoamide succinyltransferase)